MIVILCSVFFLSGASALIFESIWFQLLGISVGNSVYASTIVLSAFMAGLAIGNGLAIVFGRRVTNPVKLYAYLELIIAVAGLSVVIFLPKMTSIWVPLFQVFLKQSFTLNFMRGAISFVLLVLPATAMGATLPMLVKVLLKQNPNFGHVLGMLYGWNTLGAVFGVMANELLFVRSLGLTGTGILAAGLNILVASVVLILYRQTTGGPADQSRKIFLPALRSLNVNRYLVASFFTGLLILALEVIWFRFMLLFFNGYTRNFALILAAVLSGIGLGGLVAAKWFERQPDAHRYLFLMFIAEGLLLPILYRYFHPLLAMFGTAGVSLEKDSLVLLSLIFILPVTFLSGIIFTMLGKALEARLKEGTVATGILTMANTTGGMLGAMLGGLVLIPGLGIESTFLMCAIIFGLIALLFSDKASIGNRWKAATASIVLTLVFIIGSYPYGIMHEKYLSYTIKSNSRQGLRRVTVRESLTETIQLLQKDFLAKPHYYRLMTNSHSMSTTTLMTKRFTKLYN